MIFLYTFMMMIIVVIGVAIFVGVCALIVHCFIEYNLPAWLLPIVLLFWISLTAATLLTFGINAREYRHKQEFQIIEVKR